MMAGAVALAIYSVVVCQLLVRAWLRALPATLLSLVVWLIVALGLLTLAGGRHDRSLSPSRCREAAGTNT
jgi:hypothetical protein